MFKNNQRRFQYNINPQLPDQMERYTNKYPNNTRLQEYATSTTTPLNKRGSINYSMNDQRQKINASINQTSYQGILQRNQPRGRINSQNIIKRSTQRISNNPKLKNQYGEQSFKQTKKVYFGDEQGFKEYSTANNHKNDKNRIQNQNRRHNGEQYPYNLQENSNFTNTKNEKEFKPRKIQAKQEQISEYGVNEKEIMQKIGRINRLNEQINNRLQRMLNKIDGS